MAHLPDQQKSSKLSKKERHAIFNANLLPTKFRSVAFLDVLGYHTAWGSFASPLRHSPTV